MTWDRKENIPTEASVVLCLINEACGLRGRLWRKGSERGTWAATSLSLLNCTQLIVKLVLDAHPLAELEKQ